MTLRRILLLSSMPLVLLMGGTFALAQANSAPSWNQMSNRSEMMAQMGGGPHRGGRPNSMEAPRGLEDLDLSTEQTDEIRTIQAQSRESMTALGEQMQQAHEQMRSLLDSNATDAQLRQQHQQMQTLQQQMANQRFETMLQVRQVLTPEQQAALVERMESHRDQAGGRQHSGPRQQGEGSYRSGPSSR